MKIYLYLSDNGDGSNSIFFYKSKEDREKRKEYDEENMGYSADGCDEYEIDTGNIKFSEPPEEEE